MLYLQQKTCSNRYTTDKHMNDHKYRDDNQYMNNSKYRNDDATNKADYPYKHMNSDRKYMNNYANDTDSNATDRYRDSSTSDTYRIIHDKRHRARFW